MFFLEVAKYTEKFIHIKESLYFYDRTNENSITRKYLDECWNSQIIVLDYIISIFNELNMISDIDNNIIGKKIISSIYIAINNEIYGNIDNCEKYKIIKIIVCDIEKYKMVRSAVIISTLDKILIMLLKLKCKSIAVIILIIYIKIINNLLDFIIL